MSNWNIGTDAEEVYKARELDPISKVVVICGKDEDGNEIVREAGDNSGRTLEVQLPILAGDPATAQAVADAILLRQGGYKYQPFEARTAVLDPLAELGDSITVGDVYSVIASKSITLDVISSSDVSAPADNAQDHEYPYQPKPNREITRRLAQDESSIRINSDEIALRVKDATGVGTSLTITANGAAFSDEDGNVVEINGGTLKAGTVEADYVVAGISITAPTITGGEITGGEIYGGKFGDLDKEAFIIMKPYTTDGYGLLFCTPNHDESSPIFKISATDMSSSLPTFQNNVKFYAGNELFLQAIQQSNSSFITQLYGDMIQALGDVGLHGKVFLSSDAYGSTLPTATAEDVGRLFFLVS